jgi:RIO kinase 2
MKVVGVDGDGDPEAARGGEDSGDEDEDEEEGEEDGEEEIEAGRKEESVEGKTSDALQDEGKDISLAELRISDQT